MNAQRIGVVVMGLLLVLVAPASRPSLHAQASSYVWRNVQIVGGGFVPGVVFNESTPGLVYARADIGGAYRLDTATNRWIPLLDWVGWDQWGWTGVVSLATDPVDPNRVYLAVGSYTNSWDPNNGAILRSADRGATWSATSLPFKLGGNMPGRSMGERLVIDPNKNSILYLGSPKDGLWRSTDYGVAWSRVVGFPNAGDYIQDPADPNDYLNQPIGVVWVTFDKRTGAPGSTTQHIYAGVADKDFTTIYRSTDGGTNWTLMAGQPMQFCCPQHGVLDHVNGILYITYSNTPGPYDGSLGDVWKYETATGAWTRISPMPSDDSNGDNYFGYGGLAVDRQNPNVVMVTSFTSWWPDEMIWRSTNRGVTWTRIWDWTHYPNRSFRYVQDISVAPWLDDLGEPPPRDPTTNPKLGWMVGDLDIDPFNSNRFMYVTGATIYGSDDLTKWDAGQKITIKVMAAGIEETSVAKLVSPPSGAPLVSGLYDIYGFRHDSVDVVPQKTHREPWFGTHDLDFAELAPAQMFRVGKHGWVDPNAKPNTEARHSAYSTDGGSTWTKIANDIPGVTGYGGGGAAAISANGKVKVWAPDRDPTTDSDPTTWVDVPVHYTTNNRDWVACSGVPAGAKLASDRANTNKFYAFKDGRFYVSTDGAKTFRETAATGLPATAWANFSAVAGFEGHIGLAGGFTGGAYGLWYSNDSGTTFIKLTNVDEADAVGFGKAAPGQTYPTLYTSAKVGGVRGIFRSDNAGAAWVRINDNAHQWAWTGRTITGDPRIYGRVYVGTNGRGIIYGEPQ